MPNLKLLTLAKGLTLGRVRMQVTHAKSGTDPTLELVPGAIVQAFRLGATSSEQVALYDGSTVQVHVSDAGQVQVGDMLFADSQIDMDSSEWLYVSAIAADRSWIEVQHAGEHLVIFVGTRMTPSPAPPQMYSGGLGGTPIGSATADSRGNCDFYTQPRTFDYTVHYPGATG